MTDKEFRAEIKNGLSGGYLLYGDEEYLKERLISLAKKAILGDDADLAAFNLVETDENSYTDSFLDDAISTVPMMSDKVCVVCRVRFSELKEAQKKELYSSLDALSAAPSTVLFLVIPSGYFDEGNLKKNKPSSEYKELTERLTPVCFAYQTPAVLKKWELKRLSKDGIGASDASLDLLNGLCGPDMNTLSGELEKLVCYALSNKETDITERTVREVCSETGELDAFALSNAVVSGEREVALEAIRECRDKKQKPTYVLVKMTSEFMNMMSVSLCRDEGMTKEETASKLGIHPFRVGKYLEALRNVDPSAIRAVIDRCTQADDALKSSGASYEVLERLVCTIPAKKRFY
ncbi:MAG: DNA polymerase III subunit delta [Clostridia bacterium]|nr:DNA polymerase III subunit delta [Clostridia bacterium]